MKNINQPNEVIIDGVLYAPKENDYPERIFNAIEILQSSDGFKAQAKINQAIQVLLGKKIKKYQKELIQLL